MVLAYNVSSSSRHAQAALNETAVMAMLLRASPDLSLVDNDDRAPLHVAISEANAEVTIGDAS